MGRSGVRSCHAPGSVELKVEAQLGVLPASMSLKVTRQLHPRQGGQLVKREASRMKEVGAGKQGPRPSPKDFPAVRISK